MVLEMSTICRACLEVVDKDAFFYIDTFDNSQISNSIPKDVLLLCVPEMDLYISEHPGVCSQCLTLFERFSDFKNRCLASEDKILSYLKKNHLAGAQNKINLTYVIQDVKEPENNKALAQLAENREVDLIKIRSVSPGCAQLPKLDEKEALLFTCNECSFVTMEKEKLLSHKCLTLSSHKFKCEFCDYSTSRRYRLTYHVNSKHTRAIWYDCNECSYKTTDSGSLKRHQKVVHVAFDANTKFFSCNSCDFKALTELACQRHQSATHGPALQVCNLCNYQTRDKSNFRKHLFVHGDKPKKCTKCSYQCVSPYQLQRHYKKSHT